MAETCQAYFQAQCDGSIYREFPNQFLIMDRSGLKAVAKANDLSAKKGAQASIRPSLQKIGDVTMEAAAVYKVMQILKKERLKFRLVSDRPDTIRIDDTLYGLRLENRVFR